MGRSLSEEGSEVFTHGLNRREGGNLARKEKGSWLRVAGGAAFLQVLFFSLHAHAQSLQYTYGSPRPHAPVQDQFFSYEYDANGNLNVVRDRASGQVTQQLSYTAFNKLSRAVSASGAITEYRYDAGGNRIEKVLKDPSGNILSREKYYGPVETKDGNRTFYYHLGARRIAQKDKSTGQTLFYHQDHLGSTSLLTNTTGAFVCREDHYEFGAMKSQTIGGLTKYGYNGKERDNETNFYDYGARPYAAKWFKFATADNLIPDPSEPKDLNRYAYVGNNPLQYIDPTGHFRIEAQLWYHQTVHTPLEFNASVAFQEHNVPKGAINTGIVLGSMFVRDILLGIPQGIANTVLDFGDKWKYGNWHGKSMAVIDVAMAVVGGRTGGGPRPYVKPQLRSASYLGRGSMGRTYLDGNTVIKIGDATKQFSLKTGHYEMWLREKLGGERLEKAGKSVAVLDFDYGMYPNGTRSNILIGFKPFKSGTPLLDVPLEAPMFRQLRQQYEDLIDTAKKLGVDDIANRSNVLFEEQGFEFNFSKRQFEPKYNFHIIDSMWRGDIPNP